MENHLITGIHHITALASGAKANKDFYTDVLGQLLVKRTVNFDAPEVYHLYYGDAAGNPGTLITFFPYEGLVRGRRGAGQVQYTRYAAPKAARAFWSDRLIEKRITFQTAESPFGEPLLRFTDPDGMGIEIVFTSAPGPGQPGGNSAAGIPTEAALTGFHSAQLHVAQASPTEAVLEHLLGYTLAERQGAYSRWVAPGKVAVPGHWIDIYANNQARALQGAGSIHHIAFRTPTEASQRQVRALVEESGLHVTDVLDRNYFRSIYFREPGGILFEVATDPPGMATDEPLESLGQKLQLPEWLEPRRTQLEGVLAPLD